MSLSLERTPTKFEEKVYEAVTRIPIGKVTTYREIGLEIGCRSAQAIGQALKRNPNMPDVPCHRVVKSDLTIGGYAGRIDGDPIDEKVQLLLTEGVQFANEGAIAPESLFTFS